MVRALIVFALLLSLSWQSRAKEPLRQPVVKEPELQQELLRRMDLDQKARGALVEWERKQGTPVHVHAADADKTAAEMAAVAKKLLQTMSPEFQKLARQAQEIDVDNTAWMKQVIENHGWPTAGLVGKEGAKAAWLLVQHADQDVSFQRQCLDLMTALPKESVSQQELAYLTDRVLLAEGKKQRYGTQFVPVGGKFKLRPTEDEATLDDRRREAGLPPIAEYLRSAEQFYGNSKNKGGEAASAKAPHRE
ncbi:MAG: hypothetical protein KF847_06060 [Pirellulales bacterium]|nr:hypothetical protein [Pirellulales bacterium]